MMRSAGSGGMYSSLAAFTVQYLMGDEPEETASQCVRQLTSVYKAANTSLAVVLHSMWYLEQFWRRAGRCWVPMPQLSDSLFHAPANAGPGCSWPIADDTAARFRLLIAATVLATKFCEDQTYTNRAWTPVAGIDLAELNRLEIRLLSVLKFDLHIAEHTYTSWLRHMLDFMNSSAALNNSLPQSITAAYAPGSPSALRKLSPYTSPSVQPKFSPHGSPLMQRKAYAAPFAPVAMESYSPAAHAQQQALLLQQQQAPPFQLPVHPNYAQAQPPYVQLQLQQHLAPVAVQQPLLAPQPQAQRTFALPLPSYQPPPVAPYAHTPPAASVATDAYMAQAAPTVVMQPVFPVDQALAASAPLSAFPMTQPALATRASGGGYYGQAPLLHPLATMPDHAHDNSVAWMGIDPNVDTASDWLRAIVEQNRQLRSWWARVMLAA